MSSDKKNDYDMHVLEKIEGTRYPYYNLDGPIRKNLAKFKTFIAPINPFAYQQVPSKDRVAFVPTRHGRSWLADPLPNPVQYDTFLFTHPDPLEGDYETPTHNLGKESRGTYSTIGISGELLPMACVRTIRKFERCEMINGKEKCGEEGKDILQICPNFALDEMRKNKLQKQSNRLTQIAEYNLAMEVSDYNKGRSVNDINEWKRYEHGLRKNLRPDTFWADVRYINVTQEDIDQAKVRHQARLDKLPKTEKKGIYKQPPIDLVYSHTLVAITIRARKLYNSRFHGLSGPLIRKAFSSGLFISRICTSVANL